MCVGICLERTPELLVAILGVLKAGGAYVPLDPAYPAERLAFMLEDSQAALLITTTDDRRPTTDDRPTTNNERPTTNDGTDTIYRAPTTNDAEPRTALFQEPGLDNDLITQNSKLKTQNSKLPSPPHLVTLSEAWPSITQPGAANPVVAVTLDQLAYVIYTSGSTGRPKGVAISHHSAVVMLAWAEAAFAPADRAGVLASTSIGFDLSVFELFVPLCWGGTVILAQDVLQLPSLRSAALVTLVNTVPSAMAELLRADALPSSVRTINLAGEVLPRALAQQLAQRCPLAQLYNLYGPTEATTYATCALISPHDSAAPPIGRPIRGTQVYLLDRYANPMPIGVVGELYIGGAGLARGYLARPDLTAERFIPNLFADQEQRTKNKEQRTDDEPVTQNSKLKTQNLRLYRTGDLARYRPDGQIEFLGRRDEQVKLRGYRIELGEIEAVLRQHVDVQDAAVLAREDTPGDKRLVAYIVEGSGVRGQGSGRQADKQTSRQADKEIEGPTQSSVLSPQSSVLGKLRTFLKERLPDYMVPAAFVRLEALPLTPNGKLDRRALPAPADARSAPTPFVAARTPEEELLAQIWGAVLGVAQVGVHDNFFALGGHSLLATQVVARVRETFQVELSLRALFEAPTVAALAAALVTARQAAVGLPAPLLRPVERSSRLPLSFAQRRLWFLDHLQPGLPTYNIPAAVRLSGALDVAALHASFDEIIRRHEVLRTTFVLADEQPVQHIARPAPHPLVIIDLRTLPAAERGAAAERLATTEARQPFDLSRGPLIRTALLRLEQAEHLLLLTMHHIVSDGWSIGVMVRELAALYAAFADGRPSPLPPLPIQYADYAIWQHAWLQGSGVRGQGATARLPPPARVGTEGGGSQESDIGDGQTQNSKLKTQNSPLEGQLTYWRHQLGDDIRPLELPTDRVRPPLQTFRGAQHTATLPLPLSQALAALSRREGVTLFMTLLAAFQALLSRYSSQDDIAVGAPIAGRTQAATEQLIGCFVNTLVLRASLAGRPTFAALLRQVREVCLGAYAHQDLPFELLVEALHPERDLSRPPLVQVLFALQNTPSQVLELPQLTLRPLPLASNTAKFDLSVSLTETSEGLLAVWEYNTDLFDAASVRRMLTHFEIVLDGAVADPSRRLADLPLLTPAEQHQLLVEWNATQRGVRSQESGVRSETACIQDLFAAQAARTPDAVAVIFDQRPTTNPSTRLGAGDQRPTTNPSTRLGAGDQRPTTNDHRSPLHPFTPSPLHPFTCEQLTYHELNCRANQLARYLQTLGVGPEVLVGVCMQRSLELLVALLGVLKAGGAYLPLDPSYPAERLAFMLEDSQAAVLITTTDDRRPTTDDQRSTNVRARYIVPPTTTDDRSTTKDGEPRTKNQEPGLDNDLITQNSKLKTQNSKPPSPPHLVTLSELWPMIAHLDTANLTLTLIPDQLAYVIYTSGSTGRPKGVAVSQRALLNALISLSQQPGLYPSDTLLALTTLAFDIAAFELLAPLLCGARIALATREVAQDGVRLAQLMQAVDPTLMQATPATWRLLLASGWRPSPHLRLLCGGEALDASLAALLNAGGAVLWNLYGPTETTIWSTRQRLVASSAQVLIGRPLDNTVLYVLDRQAQPVPLGVAGELYIGGEGVARGYHYRPDLTAERFVPNPFWGMGDKRSAGGGLGWGMGNESAIPHPPSPIPRLYRTGDLVRYRADGRLEFVGRLDGQVKLRGFRIELGEIEAVLRQHEDVQGAVVLAREDAPGEKRLVAYIAEGSGVRGQGSGRQADKQTSRQADKEIEGPTQSSVLSPQSSVLRAFLQKRLPDYMVPSAFVRLEALPLTPNGKLDRRALPAPNRATVEGCDIVAPRTPLELQLVQIWEELLDRRPIGVTDNFFELGGHSLLAMRLTTHIQRRLGQELPLAALFQATTVEQLAALLQQHKPESRSPLVAIQAGGARRPFFCVHPVGGDVLCYAALVRQLAPDQPFYGLRAAGLDEQTEPCADIRSMAARYVDALRAVQPHGPYLLGGWSMGGVIAFEMAGQLRAHGEEIALLALLDAWTPALAALPPDDDLALLAGFAQNLGLAPDHVRPALDPARQLEPDALLPVMLEQARAAHVVPPDIELPQVQRLFHVFKTHTQALRSYVPQVYPGRLTLLRANERFAADGQDSAQGWGALAAGGVTQYAVPGSHFTILRSPHVQGLGERLSACLDEAHGLD